MVGAHTKPVTIPAGSEVQTPTGRYKVKYRVSAGPEERARTIEKTEPAEFIFRSSQDTVVRPMRMKEIRTEDLSNGNSAIILRLQLDRNVTYADLELKNLRIYLDGSASLKYTLLFYFLNHFHSVEMREVGSGSGDFVPIKDGEISVPGLTNFHENGSGNGELLPYSKEQFGGFRLLQEYFAFPERFFFLDIHGLQTFQASDEGYPVEIKLEFSKKLHRDYRPKQENIRLHCVPIINLFDRPVEEVPVTQRMPEYHIIPDLDRRKSREIYSVNSVIGIDENRVEQFHYLPVTSYDVLDTYDPEYEYKRFYSIIRRDTKSDMANTYIRLFGPSMDLENFPRETLSLEATLSNGFLPAKYLEVESITEPVDFPAGINVRNITAPTDVLPYPERENFLWALISHLSVSYQTVANTENLKKILSLYNWSPSFNNPDKKRIESIIEVKPPEAKHIYRNRGLIRGIQIKVRVDGSQFEHGEGDLFLFVWVLNRFLSEYVTFNSYVILKIVNAENNKAYTWEPNLGRVLPV
jgi:type VI secretion system protein ImpG